MTSDSLRCWMRIGGHDVELRVGRTLIGRHDSCQVVLDDPLASRRHAAVQFDGHTAVVHDLGSVNGVLVNGARINGTEALRNGDELRLGNQSIHVYLGPTAGRTHQRKRWGAETLSAQHTAELLAQPVEEATAIRDGEALETLVLVANKMLALGRGDDAERIVRGALNDVAVAAQHGSELDAETLELASTVAVKLAEATRRGEWINYVFRLYQARRMLVPASVIDLLYSAVRAAEGIDIGAVRAYVSSIADAPGNLGPAQRFLVRRLEGLSQLAALS